MAYTAVYSYLFRGQRGRGPLTNNNLVPLDIYMYMYAPLTFVSQLFAYLISPFAPHDVTRYIQEKMMKNEMSTIESSVIVLSLSLKTDCVDPNVCWRERESAGRGGWTERVGKSNGRTEMGRRVTGEETK